MPMQSRLPSFFLLPLAWVSMALILAHCGTTAPPLESLGPEKLSAKDGKWTERRADFFMNGLPLEIWYVYRDSSGNFIRHGSDRHFYRNGQLKFQEHYLDGMRDSVTEFWYQNGAKQGELPFRGGKTDGKAITWYPNGIKKSEKTWMGGQLHGPSREWDSKGRLKGQTYWSQNAMIPPPKPDTVQAPGGPADSAR